MITNQSCESTLNNSVAPSMAQRRNGVFRTWCASLLVAALSITGLRGAEPLPVSSVTASAHDGNVPANTVDGSFSTRWSASGDGQWIQFDFGASRPVGSVAIAWYQGDQRTSRFAIRTSLDQSVWTPVFSGVSSGTTTGMEVYDVADSTARYVSIVCHGNSVNLWNSMVAPPQ
jgi:F5/8 type C domain-containing protein